MPLRGNCHSAVKLFDFSTAWQSPLRHTNFLCYVFVIKYSWSETGNWRKTIFWNYPSLEAQSWRNWGLKMAFFGLKPHQVQVLQRCVLKESSLATTASFARWNDRKKVLDVVHAVERVDPPVVGWFVELGFGTYHHLLLLDCNQIYIRGDTGPCREWLGLGSTRCLYKIRHWVEHQNSSQPNPSDLEEPIGREARW